MKKCLIENYRNNEDDHCIYDYIYVQSEREEFIETLFLNGSINMIKYVCQELNIGNIEIFRLALYFGQSRIYNYFSPDIKHEDVVKTLIDNLDVINDNDVDNELFKKTIKGCLEINTVLLNQIMQLMAKGNLCTIWNILLELKESGSLIYFNRDKVIPAISTALFHKQEEIAILLIKYSIENQIITYSDLNRFYVEYYYRVSDKMRSTLIGNVN